MADSCLRKKDFSKDYELERSAHLWCWHGRKESVYAGEKSSRKPAVGMFLKDIYNFASNVIQVCIILKFVSTNILL